MPTMQPMTYPPPPVPPPSLTAEDVSHLKILAICHYVYGGLLIFTGLIFTLYIGFGALIMTKPEIFDNNRNGPPPDFLGPLIAGLGVVLVLLFAAVGVTMIFAGRSLSRHRNWMFCMVMACLVLLNIPMGTVLGIFTIIVLNRPQVKAALRTAR
jgi:hypothetical protein